MTFITAHQTKLNLELVPKENRIDIGKCNGRIPRGLKPKEETFQVILDALALTPCYPAFVITADVPEVYMHQFWNSVYKHHDFYRFKINKKKRFKLTLEVFRDILQICPRIEDQDFDAFPSEEDTKTLSWRNKIGIHTSKDDYLINTLRFVSRKEASQKYRDVLPECLTSPQMKESKAYKTYLGYATGTLPPKVTKKFRKASTSKKDSMPVAADEEPVQKGKRVKRSAKKSLTTPTTEVRKKSLMDFHKSHPSGSGLVAKKPPSVEKITPPVTSEGTGDKPGVPDVTKDESTENDDEDDDNDDDQSEGDEDRGIDSDEVPNKKADVGMIDAQQEKENLEITQEQVVEDAHVTIMKKTKVPVTSSSLPRIHTSTLLTILVSVIPEASPVYMNIPQSSQTFTSLPLQSTPSPLLTTKTTNIPPPILDFALVFRFNDRVIALEKDVAKLKNDPLHTQVTALVDDHLDTRMEATIEEFMNFLWHHLLTGSLNKSKIICLRFSQGSSVHAKEPEFEVRDTNMPQGQERNQGKDNDEPMTESASRRAWFTKPSCPFEKMSRDVLTVGSTMRIPLLYRGEYSQWVKRFMNYLKEQMDEEEIINSIKNGDQPLPRVTQMSIAGTSSTEQPHLKDKFMCDQEKKIQKIDCLARSILIQGLPNDIYSLIDSNKTTKRLMGCSCKTYVWF
nr:hypothetical protein [Tanacetum cinerariifolium]